MLASSTVDLFLCCSSLLIIIIIIIFSCQPFGRLDYALDRRVQFFFSVSAIVVIQYWHKLEKTMPHFQISIRGPTSSRLHTIPLSVYAIIKNYVIFPLQTVHSGSIGTFFIKLLTPLDTTIYHFNFRWFVPIVHAKYMHWKAHEMRLKEPKVFVEFEFETTTIQHQQ